MALETLTKTLTVEGDSGETRQSTVQDIVSAITPQYDILKYFTGPRRISHFPDTNKTIGVQESYSRENRDQGILALATIFAYLPEFFKGKGYMYDDKAPTGQVGDVAFEVIENLQGFQNGVVFTQGTKSYKILVNRTEQNRWSLLVDTTSSSPDVNDLTKAEVFHLLPKEVNLYEAKKNGASGAYPDLQQNDIALLQSVLSILKSV